VGIRPLPTQRVKAVSEVDRVAALQQELQRLREVEVRELKVEIQEGKLEIARLRRGLYGENGIYKGLSGEFQQLREKELSMLRQKVEKIEDVVDDLGHSDKQRTKREAAWSRWAYVLVPVILSSALIAVITLVTLILQTYAFTG
jgi:DNA gyrase/topoisomerase IV subunit A